MCIGTPMRVLEASSDAALAGGRGRVERIDTRLVGSCAPGEWLLVFQGAARERLAPQRAAEIDAALDLLEAVLVGDAARASADPGFALPSAMSAAQLAALTGRPAPSDLQKSSRGDVALPLASTPAGGGPGAARPRGRSEGTAS